MLDFIVEPYGTKWVSSRGVQIVYSEGSSNSIGKENENCLLLSDSSISRSLPMLLCHEENVEGAHSVSTGKINKYDKLATNPFLQPHKIIVVWVEDSQENGSSIDIERDEN